MYENEIYSGNEAGNNTNNNANNIYGDNQRTGGYYSGSVYGEETGRYTTYQTTRVASNIPEDKPKKVRNKDKNTSGFLRRAVTMIALGVLFGAFAGGAFFAVDKIGNHFYPDKTEVVNTNENALTFGTVTIDEGTDNSGMNLSKTTVIESDISEVVENVMPAMVSIINNYTETTQSFWGQTYSQEASASGSGIIVSENEKELLIATNAHVVEGANTLEVTFIDDSKIEAKIKGIDTDMDLAVIAVAKADISEESSKVITIAKLGDSDALKLGQPVIAIGNALGYGQSVTNGIVSALNREITLENGSTGTFIQTNAAINPGNSGGALLNINGEVIGINSNKIGGSAVEGMGYAIPITSASPIISELLNRQTRDIVDEAKRGYIGISLQEVTSQISQMYNMPKGIYIVEIVEGGGAEGAGLMQGDIITKFDGQGISSYSALQEMLQYYSVGDSAKITYERFENGEYVTHDTIIKLGAKPEK